MVTVSVLLTLHLPGARTKKERRAVVRSLVERLRTRLDVSAAEVGDTERLQHAQIGFAVVSGERATALRLAEEAQRFADLEVLGRAEIVARAVTESVLPDDALRGSDD